MNHQQMRDLAGDVAATLTAERGEPWQCTQADTPADTDYPGARLDGPAGARLQLREGWQAHVDRPCGATGKVTVTGLFPAGQSHGTYTANVNPARGARTVAREAARRVLDAGYLAELPGILARKHQHDQEQAERLDWLRRAAWITGQDAPADAGDRIGLGHLAAGYGDVRAYWTGSDRLNIELSGIPAETALRMLAVLAETAGGPPAAACTCCINNVCECKGAALEWRER